MEPIVAQYLDKMLAFEEAGYVDEAMKLSDKILETFGLNHTEILFEVAKMKFRIGRVKEALLDFVDIYGRTGSIEIYELILEAYYLPNKEKLQQVYYNNMQSLKKYLHYRNDNKDVIESVPIWQDEAIVLYANLKEKKIHIQIRITKDLKEEKDNILMLVNEFWMEDILEFERSYHISVEFMDADLPMYLVYDKDYWDVFVQIYDIKELISKNRVVFLVGEKDVYTYLKEEMVLHPNVFFYNAAQDIYSSVIERIHNEQQEEWQRDSDIVKCYYESHVDDIINRVREKKPRIAFLTSRFTTALQYHTRDCMQAAERCGCKVELWIEPDGIHRIKPRDIAQYLARFKPDIIFNIDHFRFRKEGIPKEILWVTWIQDDLPHILDKETPLKLTERDFIMNHFVGYDVIKNVGYPIARLMDAPIVANNYIYKPYDLTEDEKEKYETDICMVCHASDVEDYILHLLDQWEETKEKDIIRTLLNDYCEMVMREGVLLYTREEMREFIKEYVKLFYNIDFSVQFIDFFSDKMMELNQRIFRQALADWLIEAGYYNIKLWGNGWLKSPKYKSYAMGAAQNGEVLSKILQSSKIVLGNNVNATGAARAWESMLSGAFYMSNYVPPEADAIDIRKILKEDEDLVVFHDKNDLLNKVGYYLTHESERKQMAEKGRQAALEKMTYDTLMKRMLTFLSDYYQNQEV